MFQSPPTMHVDIATKIERCPFRGMSALSESVHKELLEESFQRILARREKYQVELNQVPELERRIKRFEEEQPVVLESLAVKLVREAMGVTPSEISFDPRLLDPGTIEPIESVGGEDEIESMRKQRLGDEIEREIQKRRVINALIQGGAHSIQDIFLLSDQIELSAEMREIYAKHISFCDSTYWLNPIINQNSMVGDAAAYSGVNRLDFSTNPITVRAEGVDFPFLVHELAKGALECLALHGLPEDRETRHTVINYADGAENEQWDFRIGVTLWQRFLRVANHQETRSWLFREFVSLPPALFFDALAELTGDYLGEQQLGSVFTMLKVKLPS